MGWRMKIEPAVAAHPAHLVRPVASLEELAKAFDLLGAQLTPPITHLDRRWVELARRVPRTARSSSSQPRGTRSSAARSPSAGPRATPARRCGCSAWRPLPAGKGWGCRLLETLELE